MTNTNIIISYVWRRQKANLILRGESQTRSQTIGFIKKKLVIQKSKTIQGNFY